MIEKNKSVGGKKIFMHLPFAKSRIFFTASITITISLICCCGIAGRSYLDKCKSDIIIPNSIPAPVIDRKCADTRFSLGFLGNVIHRYEFNDGNHTPQGMVDSSKFETAGYYGNNVAFDIPLIQTHLDADISILKYWFVFGGIKTEIGNDFISDYHYGSGISFKFDETVLQIYIASNGYSLKGQALIHDHQNDFIIIKEGDTSYFERSNSFIKGGNIGFQIISVNNDLLGSKLIVGFDFKKITYFPGFKKIMTTPHIGITRRYGANQIVLSVNVGTLLFIGGGYEKRLTGVFIPSVYMSWIFCKRWRNDK